MQVGAENRTKLIAASVLMLIALALLGNWIFNFSSSPSAAADSPATAAQPSALEEAQAASSAPTPARTTKKSGPRSLDPSLRFDLLRASEDTEYKGANRNIFAAIEIPIPIQSGALDHKHIAPALPQPPPGPPPPPPIDIKFFGFASRPGEPKTIFLSQGDDVFTAKEGDIIDRRYKVLRISPQAVEIEDVLNNNRQQIPLTQGAG